MISQGRRTMLTELISGCPGLGKSLTAQAAAEYLRRPLYSVSALYLRFMTFTHT